MKDIKGYESKYAACEDGRIWAFPKIGYAKAGRWSEGRYLKPYIMKNGYHVVSLFTNGSQKKFLVHRLIATTFIPNPKELQDTNHKDGNKSNNGLSNLEWCTRKENIHHAMKMGLFDNVGGNPPRGEDCVTSKLKDEQVREIRRLHSEENVSYAEIGRLFKTTKENVSFICRRKSWKHIL